MPYQRAESPGIEELLRIFGAELRRCRLHAGLSQSRLADRSGISQSSISRLERGLAPQAAMQKIVLLGAALDRRLPLAFCPHEHACAWERLDARGAPVRKPSTTEPERWFKDDS